MGENIFFQNVCRICTDETNGIPIYSEEGKKNSLEEKIRKFLSITVTEEDVLPKMVCSLCTSKLDSMDQFASMAAKMQTKLLECLNMQSAEESNAGEEGNKHKERMAQWQSQFTNGEQPHAEKTLNETLKKEVLSDDAQDDVQGSLLHSILTKGQGQAAIDVDVTELEVRVDPMLFLCDPDDEAQSNDGSFTFSPIPSSFFSSSTSDESTGNSSDQERIIPKQGIKSKPYQCGLCPRSFYSDLSLQSHMWNHVPITHKMIVNSDLNRSTDCVGGSGGGDTSLADIQASPVQWKCPICNKHMSTKNNLKVHLETHAVRGKHLCDICGRVFQTHTNLYRHKMYHSASQCLCQVCGRVYPTRSTLRAHQITHSNLRPHKCSLCDKTFKRNQDLKFHINQHTGERPYRCPYCPKAFASSGNCFSHRKRMHPKQLARDKIKLLSARH